jgi:hypothetical protein
MPRRRRNPIQQPATSIQRPLPHCPVAPVPLPTGPLPLFVAKNAFRDKIPHNKTPTRPAQPQSSGLLLAKRDTPISSAKCHPPSGSRPKARSLYFLNLEPQTLNPRALQDPSPPRPSLSSLPFQLTAPLTPTASQIPSPTTPKSRAITTIRMSRTTRPIRSSPTDSTRSGARRPHCPGSTNRRPARTPQRPAPRCSSRKQSYSVLTSTE